jgi:squalene synthase HpnC
MGARVQLAHAEALPTVSAHATLPDPRAVLARHGGENFPVALWFLPREVRGHLWALYGFARLTDDVGDEGSADPTALLDEIDRELDRIFAGRSPHHPLLRRLAGTVRAAALPESPLRRLVEANRRDQTVRRYARFDELLGYCALSADPVGRLVLHVFAAATPERLPLSDALCTALQLVEHWQDVAEDLARGRVYLPAEDLRRFGCDETDLGAHRASPALRRLVAFECERVRALLARGEPLVATLSGRARLAVAGFAAGGHAALDAIERQGWDVLVRPPRTRRRDWLRRWLRILWRARAR